MAEVPSSSSSSSSTWLANALGYLIGLGSLMLYTPIAVRLVRQKTAQGTTLSTWMMKLSSYTCTDLYSFWNHYPISTYIETLIITLEAAMILTLVVLYQQRHRDVTLWSFVAAFTAGTAYLYVRAPPKVLALGQLSAAALNAGALVPQFASNLRQRSKGDYSPVTAALAATGCAIRLYTVQTLADSDPILLISFGMALVLNTALLLQIVYYGMAVEGLSLGAVLSADFVNTTTDTTTTPTTTTGSTIGIPATTMNYAMVRIDSNDIEPDDDDNDDDPDPVGSSLSTTNKSRFAR